MARDFSIQEAQKLYRRLEASVAFEQEITLSPEDAQTLISMIRRLQYRLNRRR